MQKDNYKGKVGTFGGWICDTINIESHDHDDIWIGEVISRGLRIKRMSDCINVANKVTFTLKEIVERAFLETIFFPKHNPFRMHLPSGLCRSCGKGRHWVIECRSVRNI